jgi:hypothetical protein
MLVFRPMALASSPQTEDGGLGSLPLFYGGVKLVYYYCFAGLEFSIKPCHRQNTIYGQFSDGKHHKSLTG